MRKDDDLRLLFDLQAKRHDVKAGWWWKIAV